MRVEDFQLGIESYEFKINLRKPHLTIPGIEDMTPYTTAEQQEFGVIYLNDKLKKRFISIKEIKFSSGTLKHVRSKINKKLRDNHWGK